MQESSPRPFRAPRSLTGLVPLLWSDQRSSHWEIVTGLLKVSVRSLFRSSVRRKRGVLGLPSSSCCVGLEGQDTCSYSSRVSACLSDERLFPSLFQAAGSDLYCCRNHFLFRVSFPGGWGSCVLSSSGLLGIRVETPRFSYLRVSASGYQLRWV